MSIQFKKILLFLLLSVILSFLLVYVFGAFSNTFFNKDGKKNIKKQKEFKIIATLGKDGYNRIGEFCSSGANIFRINGSHIKNDVMMRETLVGVMENIKKCKKGEVLYDTQGPEIRVLIPSKNTDIEVGYEVKNGDIILIHTNLEDKEILFDENKKQNKEIHFGVNYKDFINDAKEGGYLTIESRNIIGKIENIDKNKGIVKVVITEINANDGWYKITDRRHINLFGANVSQNTLTENDKKYIKMSVQKGVKYIAVSFVRNEKDIEDVRNIVKEAIMEKYNNLSEKDAIAQAKDIKVIAKFETLQGLQNIEKIMKVADGSMIARGDLSSEIPIEEVPFAKDLIVKVSNENKKMCILATDVLGSLMTQNIPSKNDIEVIINSLKQGIDTIMLSNETAQGKNANKAISILVQLFNLYNKKCKKGNKF